MDVNTLTLKNKGIPMRLQRIPAPPKQLFHRGTSLEALLERPCVAIVGSRGVSAYGTQVTRKLAGKLAEQGIVIISGLALGVDALAHQAALDAGGLTIAVLPSSVEKPYPATNRQLAEKILQQGGALVSEYPAGPFDNSFKSNFVARNRLVAGLADGLLITEAAEQSGSLHTANFALNQGKLVMAVPGNITSPGSAGTNNLIKAGATPVTSYQDVLHAMKLVEHATAAQDVRGSNVHEQKLLDLLLSGMNDGEMLLKNSELDISLFNQTLTMLEITGKIRSLGANQWAIY
ncbi:MAG TPA: DNA-processing protein DprA [Candidatus Saccharimonadales bacterium]|nr:DNA-processing protein DprA [Candidatus Saccharimonadales bacterium]